LAFFLISDRYALSFGKPQAFIQATATQNSQNTSSVAVPSLPVTRTEAERLQASATY